MPSPKMSAWKRASQVMRSRQGLCLVCFSFIASNLVFNLDLPRLWNVKSGDHPDSTTADSFVPHIDDCGRCSECLVDEYDNHEPSECEIPTTRGPAHDLYVQGSSRNYKFPHCQKCRGCKISLHSVDTREKLLHSEFVHANGASRAWVFETQATRSNATRSDTTENQAGQSSVLGSKKIRKCINKKPAIVKLWCIPFDHHMASNMDDLGIFETIRRFLGMSHRNKIILTEPSKPVSFYCDQDIFDDDVRNAIAFRRVAEECGLDDIVPKVWVDRVKGVMPETGYPIDMEGLWQSKAVGVSLSNIAHSTTNLDDVLALLMTSINSTQVIMAAIFDLLTSQCDRNSKNVFVDELGQITLIDSSDGLGVGSMCSTGRELSSIFLPTTAEYTFRLAGKQYAKTGLNGLQRDMPLPHVLLDYRCHTPSGRIATNFPPMVSQCLEKFSRMEVSSLKEYLGVAHSEMALYLRGRSIDLLKNGFEWTLIHGRPRSSSIYQFTLQPPCCKMHIARGWFTRKLECEGWKLAPVHRMDGG